MITIVDYGSGNIGAIANILKRLKVPYLVTSDCMEIEKGDRYILPGVGAFDVTISQLKKRGIYDVLDEQVVGHKKFVLGICVGMQILAESSEEGLLPGFGWIPGQVKKIDEKLLTAAPKLPHMGWNSIEIKSGTTLFEEVDKFRGFYFLHSYYFDTREDSDVIATVEYGATIPCAVKRANVMGLQFHPEKSHVNGVRIFENYSKI